jgi:hypothetical protein
MLVIAITWPVREDLRGSGRGDRDRVLGVVPEVSSVRSSLAHWTGESGRPEQWMEDAMA